jgi:MFS family permease
MKKIPAVVWLLSFVSLLNDTASEMLYPVMPIFITQILGAPVFVVGIIEGIAEGSASLFKTFFGFWSDEIQRRKPFVIGGYAASAVSKIIIALSYSWPWVLIGRIVDRMGKGARTGARDALLLEATDKTDKGFIFGFHRAMDTTGAVIGPTIALILLFLFHNNIRLILFVAVIPAFLSLVLFIWVKEARKKLQTSKIKLSLSIKSFPPQLKMLLFGLCVFSLGNSSDNSARKKLRIKPCSYNFRLYSLQHLLRFVLNSRGRNSGQNRNKESFYNRNHHFYACVSGFCFG